jgi:hypothetical protein
METETPKRATWTEKLDAARDATVQADAAWYADLADDAKRKVYEAAKKDYRAIERAAFDDGFYWTCGRCEGTGRWVNGGVCFNCGGSGFHPRQTPFKFEASPKVRHAREAKARAKRAAEDAAFEDSLRKIGGDVEATLRSAVAKFKELGGYYSQDADGAGDMTRDESFAYSMAEKLRKYGSLSDAQVAAVQRGVDRQKAFAAEAEALKSVEPLPEGRYEIEGEVYATKPPDYEQQYPGWKLGVKLADGNRVWGNMPSAISPERGDRVKFTAKVKRSEKDEHFGFFSNPRGAEITEQKEPA